MAKQKSPTGNPKKENPVEATVGPATAAVLTAKAEPEERLKSQAPKAEKARASKESSKLSVVKNDPRATVMPINLEEEIRRRAYELSERRGFSSGHETEDWLVAEGEVLQRYRQHSA